MTNEIKKHRIYRASSIARILRIARERSVNENLRTKTALAEELGITALRLTNMEKGTSLIPLDLAYEWCKAVEDKTAWRAIMHAYGESLPPTDPQLLNSVANQLTNYIEQSQQGIRAAERLLQISKDRRPKLAFSDKQVDEIINLATEIRDTDQSSECVLDSLAMNWNVCTDEVDRRWIQEAAVDRVIVTSLKQLDEIKREAIGV